MRTPKTTRSKHLLFALIVLLLLAGGRGSGLGRTDPGASAYGSAGVRPERGSFSIFPWERVDMVNGELTLSVTDLVLPGNAGMDFRFTRTYSRQRGNWAFSFTSVPIGIGNPTAPTPPEEHKPTLLMSDWSEQRLFSGVPGYDSGIWVTTGFAKLDLANRTLYLPNGWIATYESTTAPNGMLLLAEVHDFYGNSIDPEWTSTTWELQQVVQTVNDAGGSHSRTIDFDYTSGNLTKMTYDGREWTYTYGSGGLTAADPPVGPGWDYAYGSNSLTVTTPNGGTVAYTFAVEDDISKVAAITTGGRSVTSGTWSFDYDPGGPTTTVVTTPSERTITYIHAFAEGPDGKLWTLGERTLRDGSTVISQVERTYQNVNFQSSSAPYLKVLNIQEITQGGLTFTTDYDYSTSNFSDYLQPNSVTETGNHPNTRVTTRTFATFTGAYILPKVASQTVTIGSEYFTTTMDYENSTGFLVEQTALGQTTEFGRDSFGNLATVTDPHNHQTTTAYQWGVPATVTTPEYTITRSINEDGSVASETRDGKTTTFTYDDLGRIDTVTPATGTATETTYASDGSGVTVTRGSTWATTTVDGFGRAIAAENVVGVKATTTYDEEGLKTFQSAPFTGSSGTGNNFEYDPLGRVTKVIHADSSYVTYAYSGTDVTFTDENNHTTTQYWKAFGSPSDGRLASVNDADGQMWSYSYNVFGSLALVDPPSSAPNRSWTYNSANQLTSETQPESGTTTYTYDAAGLLASKTDAENRTTSYVYDANHRLTQLVAPVSAENVTLEYDDADNRTRMVTGGTESLFGYDAANRLTSREDRINGKAFTTAYAYEDGRDNLTKITYPSGRIAQYLYDAANRVTKVYAGSTTYAEDITYHPSGAMASADFGNGTTETLTLNSRLRPEHLQTGPLDVTYDYYANGNVYTIDDARADKDSTFYYDYLDRLTSVTGFGATSFSYDAQGNRLTKGSGSPQVTYSYNTTTNRLTSASSSLGAPETGTFTYDNVGNMTSYETGTAFTYTSGNMMKTALVAGTTTSYSYDAEGMRAVKASPTSVTYYVHGLGSQLLAEYDATTGTPRLAREYLYLGGKLLASFSESLSTPPLTVHLTSPAGGTVTPSDAPVALTASASLTGSGSITSVQFYANGLPIGSPDTAAPYAVTWTPTVAANYQLTARAVASTGKVANSPPVPVTVTATGRVLGVSVSPTSPVTGQSATVTVTGNAYSCGAVYLNFGDGTGQTYPLENPLATTPLVTTHSWSTTGSKTVTATGQGSCLGAPTTNVTVTGNTAPEVSLTAPATATIHQTGAAITLTASASDAHGIASVEFYSGSTLLFTDTASPWTYSWTNAAEGAHSVTAKAFDTLGLHTTSTPAVSITVQDVISVSVSANPVAGQAATVTVYGAASGCGAVTVNYGEGEPTTYAIDGLPISNYFTWTSGGSKAISATGQGNCSGSAQTSATVNAPPSVSLTAPANNDAFYSPATVSMTATASDSDGSVASVKFYAGSTLLSTDTSSPYAYSWTGMSNGTYSITAVATDNQGGVSTSSAASITINDPSASTVTGVSVSSSSVAVNTTVTITVTGGNPCGAVQINFGDGEAPYLPIEDLPYQKTHSWSSAGTYTITASGQGNCAGQASTQITITSEAGAADAPLAAGTRNEPRWSYEQSIPTRRPTARRPQAEAVLEGEAPTAPDTAWPVTGAWSAAVVTVTVDIAVGSSGTVTSSPSGFNCSGSDTTCAANFEANTTVTLTATPASGQVFLGWGGACVGASTCQISASDGHLVTASFGASSSATITYYHTNILGSVRAITNGSGTEVTRHDFGPFGESLSPLTGDPRRFTGKERDAETAFDYLDARYFRNLWGRFTTPDDSVFMDPTNPQSFNAYAYVYNNPLRWVDPSGHQAEDAQRGSYENMFRTTTWGCLWACGVDADTFSWAGAWDFFLRSLRTQTRTGYGEAVDHVLGNFIANEFEELGGTASRIWNGTATWGDAFVVASVIPPVRGLRYGLKGVNLVRQVNRLPKGARLTSNVGEVFRRLQANHGIDPTLASERLHAIKGALGGADNVIFDLTGNVFSPQTGEILGSLTQGGARIIR